MKFVIENEGFKVNYKGLDIIHSKEKPFIAIGEGEQDIKMFRGNFTIKETLNQKIPLTNFEFNEQTGEVRLFNGEYFLNIIFKEEDNRVNIYFKDHSKSINRVYLRIDAQKDEKVYGLGEQFSYLNLRGKNYPIWTREQGVGRNKRKMITFLADLAEGAGGDYHTTFFPQPTYISTKKYFLHVEESSYMDFDFSREDYHYITIWSVPEKIVIGKEEDYVSLLKNMTDLLGRQPQMPDWLYDGVIIGVQGGTEVAINKMENAKAKGLDVVGIWAQDWEGKRITPFGKRLMWDFRWNPNEYPDLDTEMKRLKGKGVRFLGYINPYLAIEGKQYKEASQKGYLVLNKQGKEYLVDMGHFFAGIVDVTNEDAFNWYKNEIKVNMIQFGLGGWMADFGEYLPADAVMKNGMTGEKAHNLYPMLWSKLNREALDEEGVLDEVFFFTRSGYSKSSGYSTMMWNGDQNVDFSLDDGLASAIVASLSLTMSGFGLSHSDIGGYTTLFSIKRTKELFQRWAAFAAFTPMMRTHEGNRPANNWQFDSDEETLLHFAKMGKIHKALKPYLKDVVEENKNEGLGAMRPLFIHYDEERAYTEKYEYLLGRDLLVAPVIEKGKKKMKVYLPKDNWINLFTGEEYTGGVVTVDTPIDQIPAFYRKDSKYKEVFIKIGEI